MQQVESDEPDEPTILREYRDLFERLADSDLPINEDAKQKAFKNPHPDTNDGGSGIHLSTVMNTDF